MARLTRRVEWPWIAGPLLAGLLGWWAYNRFVAELYPRDLSENGTLHVITYGSDTNPSRNEQIAIFNRTHRAEGLVVKLVPGGSVPKDIKTMSAGGTAPDIMDCGPAEDIREYARLGIARPIDENLNKRGVDLDRITWPQRLRACRVRGDDGVLRTYAVPNNLDVGCVWFNRSLFLRIADERRRAGLAVPAEPWVDWTWWDYAALGRIMHKRGPDGRFTSFGASVPDWNLLYLQMRLSKIGDYAGIPDDATAAAVAIYRGVGRDGVDIYPDREALAQALQFTYDLSSCLAASPSESDENQMATSGGFGGSGDSGRFNAGTQGLAIGGRWQLGSVRTKTSFDWRLCRMPRWVPYDEWARWKSAGMAPGQRDGAWGDRDESTRQRGFGSIISGRMSFVSSSCKHPDKAFRFLEFLATNADFSRALLIEDGMGANRQAALEYLGSVDPTVDEQERIRRDPAHELGSLQRVFPGPVWPYPNFRSRVKDLGNDLPTDRTAVEKRFSASAAAPRLSAFAIDGDPVPPSKDGIGAALAEKLVARFERAASEGRALQLGRQAAWPSLATWCALLVVAVATWVGWLLLRPARTTQAKVKAHG